MMGVWAYGHMSMRKMRKKKLDYVAIAMRCITSEAARRRALISSPMPSLKSLSPSVAVLERFYCWYVTLRRDLELWPRDLDFDLWPWIFVVYRLCHGQILYQIWAQSSNPRWTYCNLNIWSYDLEHVSRVALYSETVCSVVPLFSNSCFNFLSFLLFYFCPCQVAQCCGLSDTLMNEYMHTYIHTYQKNRHTVCLKLVLRSVQFVHVV